MVDLKPYRVEQKEGIKDSDVKKTVDKYEKFRARQQDIIERLKKKELVNMVLNCSGEAFDMIVAYQKAYKIKSIPKAAMILVLNGLKVVEENRAKQGLKSIMEISREYTEKSDKERQKKLQKAFEENITNLTNSIFEIKR